MSHERKAGAIVSLKWPVHVPGAGASRFFRCRVERTVNDKAECTISAVLLRGKWVVVPEQLVWIREDCVVSRQFVDQLPTAQGELFK
jgi:hypothetical protein